MTPAKYHTSELTPQLIAETIVRADKLNIELPESTQHRQFLRDMAFAGMEAALAEPYRKIYGCYMTQLVIRGFGNNGTENPVKSCHPLKRQCWLDLSENICFPTPQCSCQNCLEMTSKKIRKNPVVNG